MKFLWIAAACPLLLAVLSSDATAAGPRQGIQIVNNNYVINDNYSGGRYGYRGGHDYGYGPYRGSYDRPRGYQSFDAAAARIQATHSRFRVYYHPRSKYNGPPTYYDWRGW